MTHQRQYEAFVDNVRQMLRHKDLYDRLGSSGDKQKYREYRRRVDEYLKKNPEAKQVEIFAPK